MAKMPAPAQGRCKQTSIPYDAVTSQDTCWPTKLAGVDPSLLLLRLIFDDWCCAV